MLTCPSRSARSGTGRPDRDFGPHVVRQQVAAAAAVAARAWSGKASGTSSCWTRPEEVEAATVERVPLWNDRKHEHGPFDIIGDVHGCCDELEALLGQLGLRAWRSTAGRARSASTATPIPRAARPSSSATWWTVAPASSTRCSAGAEHGRGRLGPVRARQPRHEAVRKLRGKNVQITHGLADTLAEIDALPDDVGRVRARNSPSSSTGW